MSRKHSPSIVFPFLCMLLLNACSDDQSSSATTVNASCTVFESGTSAYTIECPDGSSVTIHDGSDGEDGVDGADGKDGTDGVDGTDGKDGTDGVNGTDGKDGTDGVDGKDGTDGINGTNGKDGALVDTLTAKTSCSIKDNEDETFTITCPDGSSATVSSSAAISNSSGGASTFHSTTLTQKAFDNTFTNQKSYYIYDSQKYQNNMKDTAKLHIYSESDTTGIIVCGYKSPTTSIYYEADFYVTPGKSHDNMVQASDGDSIFIVYLSGYELSSDSTSKLWNPPTISKNATLAFSKKISYGDSTQIYITLSDSDLSSDTVEIPLEINKVAHTVSLIGGKGYYSAKLTLTTATNISGLNTFTVKDSANLAVSYEDVSSSKTVTDTAKWFDKIKGSIQFDSDYKSFNGSTLVYIYLFDGDNSKSSTTVWVKNENNKDSISVTLNRYSSNYFYGYFTVSKTEAEDLWVPDTSYITVSYYDESVKEFITEQSLMEPYGTTTESISFKFKNTSYAGTTDKANLSFYYSELRSESTVSFKITSTSDTIGYTQEAIYYSSSVLYNGLVGFTTGSSSNGFIQVAMGDTVYATYNAPSGKKYVAKATWMPGIELDTEDYSCTTDRETLFSGKYNSSAQYVCQNGSFRKATSEEIQVQSACVSTNLNENYSSTTSDYTCTADGFKIVYGSITDSRDGTIYKTVRIGKQTWMAENLNYAGTDNSYVSSYTWCYDDDEYYCGRYGRLYTWTAALDISSSYATTKYTPSTRHQGICPTGTHLPTTASWDSLLTVVKVENLRTNDWSNASYYDSDNSTGFNMLASGYKSGSYDNENYKAYFWTVNEYSASYAYAYYFDYSNSSSKNSNTKTNGYSIRCILD